MSYILKNKAKELAEESKNIRKEEKQLYSEAKNENDILKLRKAERLHYLRVVKIRGESRAVQLARTFLIGRDRSVVEKNPCYELSIMKMTADYVNTILEVENLAIVSWLSAK